MRSSDIFQMKKALLVIIGVLFAFVGFSAEKLLAPKMQPLNVAIKNSKKDIRKLPVLKMLPVEGMESTGISYKINRMQGPFYLVDTDLLSMFDILERLLDKPIIYSSTLPKTAKFSFKSEKNCQSMMQ